MELSRGRTRSMRHYSVEDGTRRAADQNPQGPAAAKNPAQGFQQARQDGSYSGVIRRLTAIFVMVTNFTPIRSPSGRGAPTTRTARSTKRADGAPHHLVAIVRRSAS